ncbi:MAG TPA: hypothetical protein VG838_06355 [Opitutaceae bacterium]|nr:hypothetical protein [Opitutaceae bacterium]
MNSRSSAASRSSRSPFASATPFPTATKTTDSRSPFQPGSRRLPTGLRGCRLYEMTRPDGSTLCWEAEMSLNGSPVRRRFASELHARAWLRLEAASQANPASIDVEEIRGAFRLASGLACAM